MSQLKEQIDSNQRRLQKGKSVSDIRTFFEKFRKKPTPPKTLLIVRKRSTSGNLEDKIQEQQIIRKSVSAPTTPTKEQEESMKKGEKKIKSKSNIVKKMAEAAGDLVGVQKMRDQQEGMGIRQKEGESTPKNSHKDKEEDKDDKHKTIDCSPTDPSKIQYKDFLTLGAMGAVSNTPQSFTAS